MNIMDPDEFLQRHGEFSPQQQLSALVRVLVGPKGCSWDQKQTALSVVEHLIDEAHELKAALAGDSDREVGSELGDLLFTVAFLQERLATRASTETAVAHLVEKMIRRHPHVFGGTEFADEEALKRNWEAEKRKENSARRRFDQDIPASLPSLRRAAKVLGRAMNAGFTYLKPEDALDKVWEEILELENALHTEDFKEELGDLLVALVTLSRMRRVSPEDALTASLTKLCDRLEAIEERAGRPLHDIPREDLGTLYRDLKEEKTPAVAFFNYCGVSPWPRPVRLAVRRACQEIGTRGLPAALDLIAERERLIEQIQAFCGVASDRPVVLLPNVSSAALAVAHAQPWTGGDRILLGSREFPANTVPWQVAAHTFGLEILWFDDDKLRTQPENAWNNLEKILAEQRPKLLALSAVSFWSGYRVDLERLAALTETYGVRLYIDAIQALGNTPTICPESLEYFAGGSHKALLSPEGSGFLVVSPRAAQDWQPRLASWLSLPDPVSFLTNGGWQSLDQGREPRSGDPTTAQGGSLNSLGYAGLRAALEYLSKFDLSQEFQRIQSLQDPLEQALQTLGWESLRAQNPVNRSAILSFRPPAGTDLPALGERLSRAGISAGIPNGVLRFGFHIFNNERQVERVITYFESCFGERTSPL